MTASELNGTMLAARKAAEEKKAESAGKVSEKPPVQAAEKAPVKPVKKQSAESAGKTKASRQSEDRPVQKHVKKPKTDAASREIPESSDNGSAEPLKKKVPVSGKKPVKKRSEHPQEHIDDSVGGNEGKHHAYDNNGGDEMGHVAGGLHEFLERIVPQFINQQRKKDRDEKGENQVQKTEP